ncbi:hypothetical protein ACHAQA_003006 [Verticillium albo-atrum]
MSTDTEPQVYDLLIVTDATGSMRRYLCALNQALPDIIRVSALTRCFSRIGIIAYRDYVPCPVTEWSGWNYLDNDHDDEHSISQAQLIKFANGLNTHGNYDWPEASKSGLALAHSVMRRDATTIMLLYADAPPHLLAVGGDACAVEVTKLSDPASFGGSGPLFVDWVSAARTLSAGDKKAQVFALIDARNVEAPFLYLTTMTEGNYYRLISPSANEISDLSMHVLLTWMGFASDNDAYISKIADTASYRATDGLRDSLKEDDTRLCNFMDATSAELQPSRVTSNITLKDSVVVNPRNSPMQALEKRYAADAEYRVFAAQQLAGIIDTKASAITTHPVYGSLWRAVCNDKTSDARAELVQAFGRAVDRISDVEDRQRMATWLAQSYDYTAAIVESINDVADDERYPCVLLDPTHLFNDIRGDVSGDRPVTTLSRAELLEIGRSFWKLLLHAILPGTQLSTRPAALLAALAIRMGILPLRDIADWELISFSDQWNNLATTETWNVSCLSLLLDADKNYEARVSQGTTQRLKPDACFLREEDRRLFQTLIDYKMVEFNLHTTVHARIGWQPDKSRVSLGPIVVCKQCTLPRSVTIMGKDGICGLCESGSQCRCQRCLTTDTHEDRLRANVTASDNEQTEATWVECSNSNCRGQYVVYNPDLLRVRPKCYYCLHADKIPLDVGATPTVECTTCLNRMIWPLQYRPQGFDATIFRCPACVSDRVTVIDYETNVTSIREENGSHWLLRNDNDALREPFNGRSLFHIISNVKDPSALASNVEVLPAIEAKLTIRGKSVQNQEALLAYLQGWINQRRSESGTCTLCFSDFRKTDLHRACGRRGCAQMICGTCLDGWYGLNARGKILNLPALSCPFCRRQPTARTAGKFGLVHLGGLREAVSNPSWIYAWCRQCGFAKEFAERVCAEGAPADVQNWQCHECEVQHAEDHGKKVALMVRECPGCGTMTQKEGGCDHIECPSCQAHWCFQCGKDVGQEKIYQHMSMEHGGWWGGRDVGNDDDAGDYEDYED